MMSCISPLTVPLKPLVSLHCMFELELSNRVTPLLLPMILCLSSSLVFPTSLLVSSWDGRRFYTQLVESGPFSCSTSGRRDPSSEWCFVWCFSKRGPLSPTLICHRSLSIRAPQWLIVSAKSPSSRPDLNITLLPNSDPGFRFASKLLSVC